MPVESSSDVCHACVCVIAMYLLLPCCLCAWQCGAAPVHIFGIVSGVGEITSKLS